MRGAVRAVVFGATVGVLAVVGCRRTAKPGGMAGAGGTSGAAASTGSGFAGAAGTPGTSGAAGAGTAGAGGSPGTGGTAGAGGTPGTGGSIGSGGTPGAGGQMGVGGAAAVGGGGATGIAGAGGSAGQSGASGTTGAAGTGGASACAFDVHASLSTAIPTVGIVTFTTGLPGTTAAEIRFGRASSGPTMTAPVDLTQPDHRTLLLGMKPSQPYVFRIVATSAGGTCTSEDHTLMTGALPAGPPSVMATIANAAAHAGGFIITTTTTAPTGAYIIDADGTPVWWAPFPTVTSRAHMGWDGRDMYIVAHNPNGVAPGATGRVSMDGLNVENALSGLDQSHHDLTAIPGGIAVLSWHGAGTSVVERAADGTVNTVAELANIYNNAGHANALHYTPWDDSYTVSDRNANLFVKITRKGQLVWQFGGTNPKDPSKFFTGLPPWTFNHGHHLLSDGTFLFFNNGNGGTEPSTARVFELDTTTMTATSLLAYKPTAGSGVASLILGDVQRLSNGNMLVTFSSVGLMQEVDSTGQVVASFRTQTQGYAEYRDTLYGPPPY